MFSQPDSMVADSRMVVLQTLALAASAIDENEFASVSGTIDDDDVGDTFTLDVNWGDGNTNSISLGTTSLTSADVNGDLVTWKISLADFPANDSWVLSYAFVKTGTRITVEALLQ